MMNVLFPKGSARHRLVKRVLNTNVPEHIEGRFAQVTDGDLERIRQSLKDSYIAEGFTEDEQSLKNIQGLVEGRLHIDRTQVVPWLDSLRRLDGARILEVGCGTGASTVALAEQGAEVLAIDVSAPGIDNARRRCEAYGVSADFRVMNATDIRAELGDESYDFILFWACLEHMTHDERHEAIAQSWEMLPSGGLWAMIDTPNRLHFFDAHTSLLPFFYWLPDDLAIRYAKHSPRIQYQQLFDGYEGDPAERIDFYRWGRGVSFHDIELALGRIEEIEVAGYLVGYMRQRGLYSKLRAMWTEAYRYERFIRKRVPDVHPAFLQPGLDLALRKA